MPEDVLHRILMDTTSKACLLDADSLHAIDVAGGFLGRVSRATEEHWKAVILKHKWIVGADSAPNVRLKNYALRLEATLSGGMRHCSHLLVIGGNNNRSMTQATAPIKDVLIVRDRPVIRCSSDRSFPLTSSLSAGATSVEFSGARRARAFDFRTRVS
jgi:hypothetical protein